MPAPSGKISMECVVSHKIKCHRRRCGTVCILPHTKKEITVLVSSVFRNFTLEFHCQDCFNASVFLVLLNLLIEQRL